MSEDMEALMAWIDVCIFIAAICSTSFPVVWAFSKWWSTEVGRVLMFQSVSFAIVMDLTLAFHIWDPSPDHILFEFWLTAIAFGLVAVSTLSLTVTMIRLNYCHKKEKLNV